MRIEVYDKSKKTIWDAFVRESKNGTFLFLRDYMEYHSDRFEDHSLIVWDEKDRLLTILPANRIGSTIISHGGLTFGGFITTTQMKAAKLLELFEDTLTFLQCKGFTNFIYKTIPYIYHKVPAEEDRYALFLCNAIMVRRGLLTIVTKEQHIPFQERRERGIKKALKNDLIICPTNDFECYWKILAANLLKNYNTTPVHSLKEITLLQSRFPDNIKLFGCYRNNRMLGGVVIYESERVAHVQYIAASDEGKALGALDLIFNYLLNTVYREKSFFDFGTSDEKNGYYLNRGLIEQKEGFGARMTVHDHYEILLREWQPGQIKKAMDAQI